MFEEVAEKATPLREARHKLGKTAAEVSEDTGIEKSSYCRIERGGETTPSTRRIRILKDYYAEQGIPITADEILFPDDYIKPAPRKAAAKKKPAAPKKPCRKKPRTIQ